MNYCQVFKDNQSHEEDPCCEAMDRYYGTTDGGERVYFCARCKFISRGQMDYGIYIGDLTTPEKMLSILKGNIFNIYYLRLFFNFNILIYC